MIYSPGARQPKIQSRALTSAAYFFKCQWDYAFEKQKTWKQRDSVPMLGSLITKQAKSLPEQCAEVLFE